MKGTEPFDIIPSGVAIAHWWMEGEWREGYPANGKSPAQHYGFIQGTEGFDLWREGNDYCYAWLEAYVDHDVQSWYLLDIRTAQGSAVGECRETRDHLFVGWSYGGLSRDTGGIKCAWEQRPINFIASAAEHRERFLKGMQWFTDQIEEEWKLEEKAGG